MPSKLVLGTLLVALLFAPAVAQQGSASDPSDPNTPATLHKSGQWRASKIIGLDIYNDRNEKLGDIEDLLVDDSGKVSAVVIGVGGFLGVGQRNIVVTMDKLKFFNEPRRTASADANKTPATTTGAGDRPADTSTAPAARTDASRWFPDHAVLSGATKNSVRDMPEFKYE